MHNHQEQAGVSGRAGPKRHDRSAPEFPIREYVGAMAAELAQMARWDGDEKLGCLLDAVVEAAGRAPGKSTTPRRPVRPAKGRLAPRG